MNFIESRIHLGAAFLLGGDLIYDVMDVFEF